MNVNSIPFHLFVRAASWGVLVGLVYWAIIFVALAVLGQAGIEALLNLWKEHRIVVMLATTAYPWTVSAIRQFVRRRRGLPDRPSPLEWAWYIGTLLPTFVVIAVLFL